MTKSNPLSDGATLGFILLLCGSSVSYMSQSVGQIIGYGVGFSGLVVLLMSKSIVSRVRVHIVFFLCMGMLVTSLSSMLLAHQHATDIRFVIQTGLYPVVLASLLLYGWRILDADRKTLAAVLMGIGSINAVVALLASLGFLSALPFVGEIEMGRHIFGTEIPSSAGLAFNVNYYSTLQGSIFLLYGWLVSDLGAQRKWHHNGWALFFLASVLVGSSRGVLAALFLVGVVWFLIVFLNARPVQKRNYLLALMPLLVSVIYLSYANWPDLSSVLRVDRGLNFRDVIWSAGIQIWLDRPVLGYGYAAATSEMLGDLIDRTGSLHSGYLSTLTRGGVLLFGLVYGSAVAILLGGLGLSRDRWWRNRWAVAIVVFWLANSAIRSFNLGGLGILPVAAGLALSTILYARYCERKGGCGSAKGNSGVRLGGIARKCR